MFIKLDLCLGLYCFVAQFAVLARSDFLKFAKTTVQSGILCDPKPLELMTTTTMVA